MSKLGIAVGVIAVITVILVSLIYRHRRAKPGRRRGEPSVEGGCEVELPDIAPGSFDISEAADNAASCVADLACAEISPSFAGD